MKILCFFFACLANLAREKFICFIKCKKTPFFHVFSIKSTVFTVFIAKIDKLTVKTV